MTWRTFPAVALAIWPTVVTAQTASGLITPIRVEASSTFFTYRDANLINNSGLIAGRHDSLYTGMWLNNQDGASGTITFDLGSIRTIVSADVWQYSFVPSRGVKGLNILSSQDGKDFRFLRSARLEPAGAGAPSSEQSIPLDVTARFIRFVVTSNWGDSDYTGLGEVKFRGAL